MSGRQVPRRRRSSSSKLTVDWDTKTLSTTLPPADQLAAISATLPEPVTVLAGGQPAEYYHEWELQHNHSPIHVPISGLGATEHRGVMFAQYTCTPRGTIAAEAVDADQLGIDLPEYQDLVENFTTGYPLLDPTREATGTRDSTYQLRLNVDPESFLPGDLS